MATPNMNLTLPVVSTTPGPLWATEVNQSLTTIDQHNHTFGNGALVPTAGLNINADLEFNGYGALKLSSVGFVDKASTVSGAWSLHTYAGDLYYTNGSGVLVPITSGPNLAAGSIGGITGLGGTSASVAYDNNTKVFTFTQNTNLPAILDVGPVIVRRDTLSSNGVTLRAASGSSNWTLTLPSALPAANSFLTVSSAGNAGYVSQTGGVTRSMIEPTGQQITGTTSAAAIFSSYTALTSTLTLTTSGNPVVIGLTADATGSDGSITLTPSSTGGRMKGWLMTLLDSATSATNVGAQIIELEAPAAGYLQLPLSSYSVFLPLAAGTHTFRLYGKVQPAGGGYVTTSIGISNAKLFVYEL